MARIPGKARPWRPTGAAYHRPRRAVMLPSLALALLLCAGGVASAVINPGIGAALAEYARDLTGPQAVALVEQWAFTMEDLVRQARYRITGTAATLSWAAPAAAPAPASRAPAVAPPAPSTTRPLPKPVRPLTPHAPAPTAPHAPAPTAPHAAPDAAAALPVSPDWSPLVTLSDGAPVIARALVAPDPSRPYVRAALVRIDLRHAGLHLVAGTQEPASAAKVARPGAIPPADRVPGRLLAAFNGGFRAANGAFGMFSAGTTWLPPQDGLATVAIYRDGHVRIGTWGQDLGPDPHIVAYRQNCPPLLVDGRPTLVAGGSDKATWGKTITNQTTTWRSGLGLSADGRYLYYAVGDGLTVPSLGAALASAGAASAMQLDINSFYTRFDTYSAGSGGALRAQKLLTQMQGDARQFLTPYNRDFFYLTAG